MPLVYAFVARRDGTILAEHTQVAGNFASVAQECLNNLKDSDEKFTVTADGYTFNFLTHGAYVYLAVADEAYGRTIPFAFLDRVRDAFAEKFVDKGLTAAPRGLDRTFGPALKREMDYCTAHPEEVSKMSSVQRKVEEVKGIMIDNVQQVLGRGEKLDTLVDRTEDLRDQAAQFQRKGTELRKKMWWQSMRVKMLVGCALLLLVLVIFCVACFSNGRNCVKHSSPAPPPLAVVPAPAPAAAAAVPAAAADVPAVAPDATAAMLPTDGTATAAGR